MPNARFGVFGLAVMGQNLARNLASRGIPTAIHNRTAARTHALVREHPDPNLIPAYDLEQFVQSIERPRPILVMVKAGDPVDETIKTLLPLLDQGDILIDGGNSFFEDTRRRTRELEPTGIQFVGTGISGGEEGALHGPSIMPGGPAEAYEHLRPMLEAVAARAPDGAPCVTHVGPDGAGHYVKMVHNGIEYADMQLIAEAYDLLRHALGLEPPRLAEIFQAWNQGDLDSYLIQITAEVLAKTDERTGRPLVDVILDEAAQKGTGKWSSQSALDLGTPTTAIAEAVFARYLSAQKAARTRAATVLPGPQQPSTPDQALVDDVRDALYASKIVAYAQGFEQMTAAGREYGWELDLGGLAAIWRAGCIIRARFLDRIRQAYAEEPGLDNLLLAPYFREGIERCQPAWRRVVARAVELGVPTPAFSSALAFYDGYRRERSPANLIQGLRDYFGAHTYKRVDVEGSFHTRWAQDGREVPAS